MPVSTLANQVRPGEAGRHEIAGADPPLLMVFLQTTGWTPYRTAMKGSPRAVRLDGTKPA